MPNTENKKLNIDLTKVPTNLRDTVIETYDGYPAKIVATNLPGEYPVIVAFESRIDKGSWYCVSTDKYGDSQKGPRFKVRTQKKTVQQTVEVEEPVYTQKGSKKARK